MTYHPAYPDAAELRREAVADDLIADDLAEIERMRAIVQTAIDGLSDLSLRFWSPPGYDVEDVIGLLRSDFLPPPPDVAAAQMHDRVCDYVASLSEYE